MMLGHRSTVSQQHLCDRIYCVKKILGAEVICGWANA